MVTMLFIHHIACPQGQGNKDTSQLNATMQLLRMTRCSSQLCHRRMKSECRKVKRIVDDLLVAELAKSSGICWRFIGSLGDFRYGFSLNLRHSDKIRRKAD